MIHGQDEPASNSEKALPTAQKGWIDEEVLGKQCQPATESILDWSHINRHGWLVVLA